MAVDVAKMLGPRHQPHLGHMRARGAPQVQRDRQDHACRDSGLDPQGEGDQNGPCHRREIGARVAPGFLKDRQIDQPQHCHDDGGRQRRLGQEIEKWRQRQRRDGQTKSGVDPRRWGGRPCIGVDDGPGKAARHRKAAAKSGSQIRDSVILHGVVIGRNCRIKRAIIDSGAVIPDGTSIGEDPQQDSARFSVSPGGVVLVTARMLGQQEHFED